MLPTAHPTLLFRKAICFHIQGVGISSLGGIFRVFNGIFPVFSLGILEKRVGLALLTSVGHDPALSHCRSYPGLVFELMGPQRLPLYLTAEQI